ncbi:kinase-like protein [Exidia glandulosa HHB12029]|uniref:Kinase-like protein n=1 Tax=Exidia glandulosa HHB12029 TaxID=1314781 RepID=A0A165KZ56_EXIGL|nr:kinase-like protein [Exidia glandulosa HHB12029]
MNDSHSDISPALDLTEQLLVDQEPSAATSVTDVYRAHSRADPSHFFAVKRLRFQDNRSKELASERRHTIAKDIESLSRVQHDNLLPFSGVCRIKEDLCIVTPWAEGGTLAKWLPQHVDANRVQIVASAMNYLHTPIKEKAAIVHGNLHSANVLMDDKSNAMVCDFGLYGLTPDAYDASIAWTADSQPRGKYTYMAPELLQQGVPRSANSDMYSFGVLTWEVYAGSPPFPDRGALARMLALSKGERPVRGDVKRADFSDAIWSIVDSCWAHNPAVRPPMHVVHDRFVEMAAKSGNPPSDRSWLDGEALDRGLGRFVWNAMRVAFVSAWEMLTEKVLWKSTQRLGSR